MATVTHAGTTFDTNASPHTVVATPAADDLALVFTCATGIAGVEGTLVDDQTGGTYTLVGSASATLSAPNPTIYCYVRDSVIPSAVSTTWTETAGGASTGGGLTVFRISGMTRTGASAIRQSGKLENQGAATPVITLTSGVALTENPLIGHVRTLSFSSANCAPPTSWTEAQDQGFSSPNCGSESVSIDSGFTSDTVTWTAATPSGFGAIAFEFDTSSLIVAPTPIPRVGPDRRAGN